MTGGGTNSRLAFPGGEGGRLRTTMECTAPHRCRTGRPCQEPSLLSVRLLVPTLALPCLCLTACGDAAAPVRDAGTPRSPAPTEPVTPIVTDTAPGIHAALTIEITALEHYALPVWPVHYDSAVQAVDNAPADNRVTDKGATLGRVLFHDRHLSINDNVSCASCHQRGNGFTDSARFSAGFNTVDRTAAHSMRLANARFYAPASAFWDRRAATFEAQATQPIQNAVEMGFDAAHGGIDSLRAKMRALRYYPELFRFVYGDTAITEDRIQRALAQYVRSIVSTDSRFDRGFAAVFTPTLGDRGVSIPFAGYSAQENRGKALFLLPPNQGGAGCAGCHTIPTFALVANARSNGLDAGETRVFKSPSLKNVALAGPYMHDGRFATLEQVVEHYASGIQGGPALDNRLRTPAGAPLRLALTADDKAALVAFMRTLTDTTLATAARFTSPFKP